MVFEYKVGQVVKSLKGRDFGELLLVYEVVNPNYLKLVNGKDRPISRPKLKKIKHVQKYNYVCEDFSKAKEKYNDANIRKILSSFEQ